MHGPIFHTVSWLFSSRLVVDIVVVRVCICFLSNGLLTRARQRDLNPLRIHMVMVTGNFSLPHIFVFALAFVYVFFLLLCSPHFFTSSKHNLFFSKFLFLRLLATKCDWWLHFSHSPWFYVFNLPFRIIFIFIHTKPNSNRRFTQ